MLWFISNFEKLVFLCRFVAVRLVLRQSKKPSLHVLNASFTRKTYHQECSWMIQKNISQRFLQKLNCSIIVPWNFEIDCHLKQVGLPCTGVLSGLFRASQYRLVRYTFQAVSQRNYVFKSRCLWVADWLNNLKAASADRRFIKIFHNLINFSPIFSEDLPWWKGTQMQHHWNHNFKVIWRLWKMASFEVHCMWALWFLPIFMNTEFR